MKNLARILSLLLLASITVFFTACDKGEDDEPDETAQQIEKLVGNWKASSVTYNEDDQPFTADYANFELTISSSSNNSLTYVVKGRPTDALSPWNANGIFTFGTPVTSKLVRDDGVQIDYSVTETTLTLTMPNYPSDKGYPTRVGTVEGAWVFTMTK